MQTLSFTPVGLTVFSFRAFFFFNDTATTEIYTLSLHDALPIWTSFYIDDAGSGAAVTRPERAGLDVDGFDGVGREDRKSTRLNSSHGYISYAVFCLKKKKTAPFSRSRRFRRSTPRRRPRVPSIR